MIRSNHLQREEIDRIAKLLMDAWARAEPNHGVTRHPASYVATFADMARAVVEDRYTARCGRQFPDGGYFNATCTLPPEHDGDCSQ